MYCSTDLHISPILPRLPRTVALLLILSLLVRTCHPLAITQPLWLPVVSTPAGRWSVKKVLHHPALSLPRAPLLARLLVRCALLGVLLYATGWLRRTLLSSGLLLLPVAQTLLRCSLPHGRASKHLRRGEHVLHRLYQLLVLALLIQILSQLWGPRSARMTTACGALVLVPGHSPPDEQAEVVIAPGDPTGYQVTLRGTFQLSFDPRDLFERWLLILFLRALRLPGARRSFLTQAQLAEAFGVHLCEVSRWEKQVRTHGWHILSDRYRHQLHSALPLPELSRKILQVWVPAFWLSAWDVRERLIARGVLPERGALSLESLHKLAHHTGFAQVRQILLERFHLQDGQLIARDAWWLEALSALNERLLTALQQGQSLSPQQLVEIEPLRLQTLRPEAASPQPLLPAALHELLFAPSAPDPDPTVRCTYCGSDQTAPKSKTPRLKTVIDPHSGHKRQIEVLRHYCHSPDCSYKSFTHFPPALFPHSPHPLQARLIALHLYEGLRATYRRSARTCALSTATCYRWVASFGPAALALSAYLGLVRTSGVVGIDDKWVKVCSPAQVPPHGTRRRAVWRYAYFAVDVYSYDLLALELYPQHNDHAVHLLLLQLKAKGIYPRVVVTDLDPAYGRMLPKVFPRTVHHECIFHAIQNALRQLTHAYGRNYLEKNPEAATLHQAVVHLFRAKTKKTVRKRFRKLIDSRKVYVDQTPAIACLFDSLERHFPKLLNAIGHPTIPRTNNTVELVIRRFDQHYQSMCGLDTLQSARIYLRVFELVYRLTPFADDNPSPIRGKCPLELAGYDLDALPIADFFRQLKLPPLQLPEEEVVPMM